MNCREFKKLIPDYLGNTLSSRIQEQFILHSRTCKECEKLFHDLEKTVAQLQKIDLPVLPQNEQLILENNVISTIHATTRRKTPARKKTLPFIHFWHSLPAKVLAAAAIILVCIVSYKMVRTPTVDSPELNPEIAVKICEDPEVWEPFAWNTLENADIVALDDKSDNTNISDDELVLEQLLTDDTMNEKSETGNSQTDSVSTDDNLENQKDETINSQDRSIWYLVDELDDQGKDQLMQELRNEFRV